MFYMCAVPILVISEGCPSGDHKHFQYQPVHSSDQDNKMKAKLKKKIISIVPCTSSFFSMYKFNFMLGVVADLIAYMLKSLYYELFKGLQAASLR